MDIRVGTAGWSIPRAVAAQFPEPGTHLQKYATRLNAAEINSSFHRPHRHQTYEKWARSVPPGFCFAVKIPRTITHDLRLERCGSELDAFFQQLEGLGDRLGPLLVQLPPSLEFAAKSAAAFFKTLRKQHTGAVVCEPRHATWFSAEADRLLRDAHVARVAADPARVPAAAEPGGGNSLAYFRLHGSPRMYYSSYPAEYLDDLAARIRASKAQSVWCIFDNTASGAGLPNALHLWSKLANLTATTG